MMCKQRLLELIKENKVKEAIKFSQGSLAEKAKENPWLLDQLEEVMSLLAYKDIKDSPMKHLIDISQRQKLASDVNKAILKSQCVPSEVKLPFFLKMLAWSEEKISDPEYPKINFDQK
mmetsp:Transcript_17509/g.17264  ORF Transcript_17509/g.17264 Transcript_17509/m.17264 type:complete len:118 (-) Transcript_17509:10-363(-)